jgi:tetratricopeptide (TPR) repeat protein
MKAWLAFLIGIGMVLISVSNSWSDTPYSDRDLLDVENLNEQHVRSLRNAQITQLREVLGLRQPVNRKADLYFQLAEIYMEGYRSEFLREGRVHEKRLEKRIPDKFIDRSHSKPYLYGGIKACEEILKFKIPYAKLDQVYYFLAFYYGELNEEKKSSDYYRHLADVYLGSPFAGIANKELGDYYYRHTEYKLAAERYEVALKKINQDNTPPILHKLAWCYYRLRGYDRAISTMKQAIAKAMETKKYEPMKDEALRDMATLMVERGRVDEAIQYFQSIAGDEKYFPSILEKLGAQYERNVEIPKATRVYETLLKTHSESEAAFRVMAKLVELDIKSQHYNQALQRLSLVPIPNGGSDETQALAQNLRVLIRKTGTEHHQIYRKKQTQTDLIVAENYYTTYMNHFLKQADPHQERAEIQMYLAEVKRDLKKFKEATDLYRTILKANDKRYSKGAGALWRDSLVEVMKKEPLHASAGPSDIEKEFIEASDLLQQTLGDSPEGVRQEREISLRSAQVLAGYPQTRPDVITRIQNIINRWPNSSQALTAAQLWFQIEMDKAGGNKSPPTPELLQLVRQLKGNTQLMAADRSLQKGKLATALDQQLTQEKVGKISQFEKSKDYSAAAQQYEVVAAELPDRNLAEKAYANALSTYLKLDEATVPILRLIGTWKTRFPSSKALVDSIRTAATNALIRGKFDFSARLFEKLGTELKNLESLLTAAHIDEAAGNASSAQRIWTKFLEVYKSSPERWAVALSLAKSLERSQLDGEAGKAYKYCSDGPDNYFAECNARLGDLYLKNRDLQQAKAMYRIVGGVSLGAPVESGKSKRGASGSAGFAKTSRGGSSPFVGYARFKMAELVQNEASFEPMRLPEVQLQKGLNQRLNFLEPLSKAYQSVVEVGGPWAIAALDKLATWAAQFADEVDAIEPPPKAGPASIEKFRKDLASVSGPLREKAKSTWNEAYQKSTQVDLFSPALPLVADHLADFRVQVPGRAQGPRGKFRLAGLSAQSDDKNQIEQDLVGIRGRLMKNTSDAAAWVDYGNLMWGEGKPLMARLFYERALEVDRKNTVALNNMAIVRILSEGEEDWVAVSEAGNLLSGALHIDDFYVPAKMNLATLLNYYRMFPRSRSLWQQVTVKAANADALDGLGIALQGMGNSVEAQTQMKKASDLGASSSRFSWIYHGAARASLKEKDGADDCYSDLDRSFFSSSGGFEKTAVEYLKTKCGQWRK